jgi:hypothetical protein
MKALSPDAFYTEAFTAFPRYQLDNPWFSWQCSGSVFDPGAPVTYIFASAAAYEKVVLNGATSEAAREKGAGLRVLLLGDTKLRSDHDLVQNFGLSSARGVQEEACREFIKGLMNERKQLAGITVPKNKDEPEQDLKGRKLIPVEGPGAILSTRKWSPMLNDSFIMAGAHQEIDFFLALTGEEIDVYQNLASVKDEVERWRQFFVKSPGSLWGESGGFPRVLMRELLGLMTFGYEPRFHKDQLGFKLINKKAGDEANLSGYLTALQKAGFQEKKKDLLLSTIATFLFGDAKALKADAGASQGVAA